MNDRDAKVALRALSLVANGCVGRFVPIEAVLSAATLRRQRVMSTLKTLASQHLVYIRSDSICIARPGLERAIEWKQARPILRAIFAIGEGWANKPVRHQTLLETIGAQAEQTNRILSELSGLGMITLVRSAETGELGVCLTQQGWEFVNRAVMRSAKAQNDVPDDWAHWGSTPDPSPPPA